MAPTAKQKAAQKAEDDFPSFYWTSAAEPHAQRRKLMLQKYGDQIRPLVGPNPWTAVLYALAALVQTAVAVALGRYDAPWWLVGLAGYAVSPVLMTSLVAGYHEAGHFGIFQSPAASWAFLVLGNAPLGLPFGSLYRQFHQIHHNELGVDGLDPGTWTFAEAGWIGPTVPSRIIFLLLFPLFFWLRPFFMSVSDYKGVVDYTYYLSWAVVLAYDVGVSYLAGWSLKPIAYMCLGLYWLAGLHPIGGHIIAEHCMMTNDGQETFTCLGKTNKVAFNFGYHLEHHDFPNIAWDKLPELRKIAPEFYEGLTTWPSATHVLWRFITDGGCGKLGVRVKRAARTGGSGRPRSGFAPRRFNPAAGMPLLSVVNAAAAAEGGKEK